MYTPKPIDTSKIALPEELVELTEKIAENVHDVWAEGRIKQGWTYGEERNDALKQTPCLVPYNELPESEKEYDRNTAVETVTGYKYELGISNGNIVRQPRRFIQYSFGNVLPVRGNGIQHSDFILFHKRNPHFVFFYIISQKTPHVKHRSDFSACRGISS